MCEPCGSPVKFHPSIVRVCVTLLLLLLLLSTVYGCLRAFGRMRDVILEYLCPILSSSEPHNS
jgi:hypothetical protein